MRDSGGSQDLRFFRAGFRCAGELINKLRRDALLYTPDVRSLWKLTGYELDEIIDAGKRRDAANARQNELLAFNTAALVLAAFNAPGRFPKTPDEAFGRRTAPPPDGGKSSFMAAAEQINKRLKNNACRTGATL